MTNHKQIIPAILEKDFDKIQNLISDFSKFTTKIQIDVCDGIYVPSLTWLPNSHDEIDGYNLDLQFDLMVEDVSKYLSHLYRYDPRMLIIHSSNLNLQQCKDLSKEIKSHNKTIQVAFCDTDISKLRDLYDYCDLYQFMGIKEIGKQGQTLTLEVLDLILELNNLLNKEGKTKLIQIDGGVNENTIEFIKESSISNFVVGSAILKGGNFKENYLNLKSLL
jgi:ribulose-phosphate 3-epimerase